MLMRVLLRWLFAAGGLALAAHVVPGISYSSLLALGEAALLLGIVNALLRPLLTILTLPLTLITLGLWLLVLNAGMIGLVGYLLKGFQVAGVVPALLAAVVTGVTSWVGHMVVGTGKHNK